MLNKTYSCVALMVLFLLANLVFVLAKEANETGNEDIGVAGLEVEKLISFINGVLALVLSGLTLVAYKKNNRPRMLFVSIAFFLFAVRGLINGAELFFPEIPYVGPISVALDLAAMLSFFYGILKK